MFLRKHSWFRLIQAPEGQETDLGGGPFRAGETPRQGANWLHPTLRQDVSIVRSADSLQTTILVIQGAVLS